MARRLPQTLLDYLIVAIAPVLIITMVVSLGWFLILCLTGELNWAACWFCFFFSIAAVLITRIAIEMGSAHASTYGFALAGAALLVAARTLPGSVLLVVMPVLAVVWWCTHKLTWDCTVVDESARASTEGLLQTIGLDRVPRTSSGSAQSKSAGVSEKAKSSVGGSVATNGTAAASDETGDGDASALSAWQRWRALQQRYHRPGTWIVYFTIASIPIFGIGQLLVPADDILHRQAFLLLCGYVASALALLMATSLLQLRRYLRQRQIAMPSAMARVWLGTGAALIGGALLAAQVLPRPGAEYSLMARAASWTERNLIPSRFAVRPDGVESDEVPARRSADHPTDSPDASASPQAGSERSETTDKSTSSEPSRDGSRAAAEASASGEGEAAERGGSRSADAAGQAPRRDSQDGPQNRDSRQAGSEPSSAPNGGRSPTSNTSPSNTSPNSESQSERTSQQRGGQTGSRTDTEASNRQPATQTRPSDFGEQSARSSRDESMETETEVSQNVGRSRGERQSPTRASQSDAGRSPQDPSPRGPRQTFADRLRRPFQSPSAAPIPSIGGLFSAIYWIIIIGAVAWLIWRFRDQLGQLVRRRAKGKAEKAQGDEPVLEDIRPFHNFADPFRAGLAARMGPVELVRYTFSAVEAWAREQGAGRHPEQTPLEFSRQLGLRRRDLQGPLMQLADLYNQAAYAPGTLQPSQCAPLQTLWKRLAT